METFDPNKREVIDNNLVWSILATLFCCLPLGIYAIILSSKVDGLVAAGRIDEARQTAEKAKNWAIYSIAAPIVVFAIYFFFTLLLGGISRAL